MSATTPQQLATFGRELRDDPALAEQIITTFPPTEEAERIIRCSPENLDRGIARAYARAVIHGEVWKVEEIAQ